ncbi:hypothetical protein P8452_17104 [Trifolium repens]|nr:hypothetical protein P8452_17104 [Trifolium repens]
MANNVVLANGIMQQYLKEFVVYVGETSVADVYFGFSTKPRFYVTVTPASTIVTQWLSAVLHRYRQNLYAHNLVVGLGVQWSHPSNNNPNPSTANTLQVCVGTECLIFQLSNADMIPESLQRFLLNRYNTFVGFWNNGDRWRLARSEHCLKLYRYPMDLRYKAVRLCNEDLLLAKLDEIASKCLGFKVEQSREIGMSNWGELNLDSDQIAYASINAYCSYLMGVSIQAWKYKDD